MIIKPRKIFVIAIGLCVFFLTFLSTKSTWRSLPEVLVFQNGNADIYLGQFFKPQENFKVNFAPGDSGNGSVTLKRKDQTLKPIAERNSYRFYSYVAGDSLCRENFCKTLDKSGSLVEKVGSDSWWSTKTVNIHSGYEAPIDRFFPLQSTNATMLLFVNTDFSNTQLLNLKQGKSNLYLNKLSHYQAWRLVYASLFSLCCVSFVFFLYLYRTRIVETLRNIPFYSTSLAIVLTFEYLAVFPGIFSTDTVINNLSADFFSIWFSSTFMVFNRLIYSLYPSFIQLPEIFIFYISSIYLASHLRKIQHGKIIIFFLFLLQILIPTFFVSIFVQQRIFLAVIVLYAAIIFSCCNLLDYKKITPIAYGFLIFSGLLRSEYWLIFLIFLLHDVWCRRKIIHSSLKPIFVTILSAIGLFWFVTYPLPKIQGLDRNNVFPHYQFVSLLDIAKPYINCNDKNDILSHAIEQSGGLESYCSTSPEKFFWKNDSHLEVNTIIEVNKTIKNVVMHRMFNDPKPAIKRVFLNIEKMSIQNYWQIYNRYLMQEKEPSSPHIKIAEKYGLIQGFSWQVKIHTIIVKIFQWLSTYLNVLISLIFIMILSPIVSRCWLTIVLNSTFIFMTLMVGFAAPVAQWYYLVFIPIWSVLIIPVDMILFASKQNLYTKSK